MFCIYNYATVKVRLFCLLYCSLNFMYFLWACHDHNKKLPLVGWLKFLNWIELKHFVLCLSGIAQRKASSVKRTSKPRYLTLSCSAVCRGQTGAHTVSHCRTLCEFRQSRTHCFYTLDQVFRMKRCPPVYSPLKFRHGISVLFWSFFTRPNDMHIINYFLSKPLICK